MQITKHFILKYRSTFYYLQHESIFVISNKFTDENLPLQVVI